MIGTLITGVLLTTAQPPSAAANRSAYSIALMCYAVAAYHRDDPATYRTNDAVRKMGKILGYDRARIADDMVTMANVMGDQIRDDPTVATRDRQRCRKIGFAS